MVKKNTNENLEQLKEKLNYIGLDINNIPECFKNYDSIEFRTIRENDKNKYKIYKFVDVNDIQIYITPKNRLDSFIDKYKLAKSIINYLDPKESDDIPRQACFFNMVKNMNIEKIDEIEEEQKKTSKKLPFLVRYDNNYLWEIYYSKIDNKYFMLVPEEDLNYECFFYLLKKQIECCKKNKKSKIYVPICYEDYTTDYLKKSEMNDIENYLWIFTKEWPNIYELFNKKNNLSVEIIGKSYIFDRLQSDYKISLNNKEDSLKFYKFIKALFILQSELPNFYHFSPRINGYGELKFYFKNKKIELDDLPDFIKNQYIEITNNLKDSIDEKFDLENELDKKKKIANMKNVLFHQKEKEITLYLECKKTFFGKIKYYFKHKKINKEVKKEEKKITNNKIEKDNIKIVEKDFYTIEDLINITKEFETIDTKLKNIKMDIKAIDSKIEMMERKIKNASFYINEIDNHKKSIFEFWKFANKDEKLSLNEASNENQNDNELQKTFEYDVDFEEFSEKIDKIQREKLSKKDFDSVYLVQTDVLECLNIVKKYLNKDKKISPKDEAILKIKLDLIQKEAEEKKLLFNEEEYDIFGSMSEDNTKIKFINGKKHRETEKNKFDILKITKNTKIDEFINELNKNAKNLVDVCKKNTSIENMSIYKCDEDLLDSDKFEVFNLDIQNCIKNNKKENLYKINLKENMNAIYLSNIMYFDNKNDTLPLGMDLSDKVLLDLSQYELELKSKENIRFNYKEDLYNKVKSLDVYEYDLIRRK